MKTKYIIELVGKRDGEKYYRSEGAPAGYTSLVKHATEYGIDTVMLEIERIKTTWVVEHYNILRQMV